MRVVEPSGARNSALPKAVNLNGDFRYMVMGSQGAVLTKDESFGKDRLGTDVPMSQVKPVMISAVHRHRREVSDVETR